MFQTLFLTLTIIEMSEKNGVYMGDGEDENQIYTQRWLFRFESLIQSLWP